MDYGERLRGRDHWPGSIITFRKSEQEVRDAVNDRISEVLRSIEGRQLAMKQVAAEHGIDLNIDAVMGFVNAARRVDYIELSEYRDVDAWIIANGCAMRLETESVCSLRLLAKHVSGTVEFGHGLLAMLFAPYSPHEINSNAGVIDAEWRMQRASKRVIKRKVRRMEQEDDQEHKTLADLPTKA